MIEVLETELRHERRKSADLIEKRRSLEEELKKRKYEISRHTFAKLQLGVLRETTRGYKHLRSFSID